jgi:hypothetical protein
LESNWRTGILKDVSVTCQVFGTTNKGNQFAKKPIACGYVEKITDATLQILLVDVEKNTDVTLQRFKGKPNGLEKWVWYP